MGGGGWERKRWRPKAKMVGKKGIQLDLLVFSVSYFGFLLLKRQKPKPWAFPNQIEKLCLLSE